MNLGKKKCSRCGEIKSLNCFNRKSSSKDGRRSHCRDCQKKYSQRPETKQKRREREQIPEFKERRKEYRQRFDVKQKEMEYREKYKISGRRAIIKQKPENKKKNREYGRRYRQRPEIKEMYKKYRQRPEIKEKLILKSGKIRLDLKNKEKLKARGAVSAAVRSGKLIRGLCGICGSNKNIEAHHKDYSKPLDVVWCCAECHSRLHSKYFNEFTEIDELKSDIIEVR
jgi:hypothetical protein